MAAVRAPATNLQVSAHAAFRYRNRVDARCQNPEAAIRTDLARGLPRLTPPRWLRVSEPGDYYVCVSETEHADRVYIIRDQLVVTVVSRPEAEDHRRSRHRHRHHR